MLVIGDEEAGKGTVAVRRHGVGDIGEMSVADFAGRLGQESRERRDLPAEAAA